MDIEKMIEQLRYLADTPSYTAFHDAKEREIICDQCEADFCYDKQQDAHWCMYEALSRAATALSTLQAENEKLRAELEQVKAERDAALHDMRRVGMSDDFCTFCTHCCIDGEPVYRPEEEYMAHCEKCDENYSQFEWRGPQKED